MFRILCWFGFHNYELNRVIRYGVAGNLMGHSCTRCSKIPESQEGLA